MDIWRLFSGHAACLVEWLRPILGAHSLILERNTSEKKNMLVIESVSCQTTLNVAMDPMKQSL